MKFKELLPDDYQKLKPYFANPPYRLSCYSLPSLICWNNKNFQPVYAILRDTLVIGVEFFKKKELRHLFMPISPSGMISPRQLHDLVRASGFQTICFVPEDYVDSAPALELRECFTVSDHPGFTDYIYRTTDLASLGGNLYSKKRNLIHQFEKTHSKPGQVEVEPISSAQRSECIEFLEQWCEERNCDSDPEEDIACEKIAAINAMTHLRQLEMNGILVRINGVVNAFGIMSRLTDDMGVLHFEKAFSRVKGLYQFLDRECARRLFNGYTYINKESDMGEAGLAKAKQSYHPAMMIKSFKLTIAEIPQP